MRKMKFASMVLFVIAVICFSTYAQGISEKPEAKKSKESIPVVIDDDVWFALANEPAHHFHRAYEGYVNEEFSASANEIRTAAAFLKLETGRATKETKKALVASAGELDRLADDVENGKVTSVTDIEQAFGRAHYALARHHYMKAKEAWEKKQPETAGKALRAASSHLERAMVWDEYGEEDLVDKVVTDTEIVADKLIEGTQLAPKDVDKALEDINTALNKLGTAIEPAKK